MILELYSYEPTFKKLQGISVSDRWNKFETAKLWMGIKFHTRRRELI
jgi:hypothetical protein